MKVVKTKGVFKKLSIIFMLLILITASYLSIKQPNGSNTRFGGNSELLRAMTYDRFNDGDEKVEGTDNVEFSAFFLRDIDGDGYGDKIKGTCKEIGKEDKLYMEVIVKTAGYLKDGKIEIDGKNFYLQTSLPKDTELIDNYISDNLKTIEFEDLNNGTQKLLTGMTRSGDYSYTSKKLLALQNDISNYSRDDNTIILTGTYVDDGGNEMPIRKEISLTVDWYGAARTEFLDRSQTYHNLSNIIHEDTQEIDLNFGIESSEAMTELLLSKNYVEGTIPELNGYFPIDVICDSKNIQFTYDRDTRKFTITKEAQKDSLGRITSNAYEKIATSKNEFCRYNSYTITVKYPMEAYQSQETDFVSISIPVKSYYEGYNNPNDEFVNPYRSDMTLDTIIAEYTKPVESSSSLEIFVGKSVYISSINDSKNIVSKLKPMRIFNGISAEEKNDVYDVTWKFSTGTQSQQSGIILKETRTGENQVSDTFIKSDSTEENMENITANTGIGFYISGKLLNDDGYIKVYDEETGNLVETFTKNGSDGSEKWDNYTKANYYKYNTPIKHIRVETSEVNSKCSLYIYNIKEIDDTCITDNYTREEFDNFKYIKSNVVAYFGENNNKATYGRAIYEEPYSLATISTNKNVLSTQSTEKNFILNIDALNDESENQAGWTNGSYLIKLPEEILDIYLNSVVSNKESVKITSYEVIKINGCNFIRVKTNNNNPDEYRIVINVDITPDPRIATINSSIKLYAVNEETDNYELESSDIYDIDNDGNTEEKINYNSIKISLISPNSLITNQTMSEFDQSGEVVVSPQVVDLKPIYSESGREKQTVKVGIQIKNNYSGTISETQILGKIPFEGNSYVISGNNLNSQFSTQMKNTGIQIPEELQSKATIYYSENSDPNRFLDDPENGWTLKENVSDWSKIKCYLIDLGDLVIDVGKEYTFYYVVEIPFGVEFNKVAYSHHGVYFTLDVPEGKYKTNTEPNRIGLRIADKYDLLLNKYQINTNQIVSGATYKVSKINSNGIIESSETAITNNNGMLEMANLYAEEIYEISEIESPENYALNGDTITIIGHIDRATGVLSVEKLSGVLRDEIEIIKNREQDYKANLQVEDEVKASINIIKTDRDTGMPVKGVKYNITGNGLDINGKTITTDTSGQASIKGIEVGEVYTLNEVRAEGYYLPSPIKIKIINNDGTYLAEIIEGNVKNSRVIMSDNLPIFNLEIEDEMIPRYNLKVNKIKHVTEVDNLENTNGDEITYLEGAKYKLYKDKKEIGTYITDSNGTFLITDLYLDDESKNIEQEYVLKEIVAPNGYTKAKDIVFKVSKKDGIYRFEEKLEDEQSEKKYTVEDNTINLTVEDNPTFRLIKRDGETNALLPNTKFAIYNVDNAVIPARNSKGEILGTKESINGKEYYILTTDINGEITLDLPEGSYKAVEVQADEKYDLSGKTYYFGINASKKSQLSYNLEWAKKIGDSNNESITSISNTTDGGYVVGGYFNSRHISEQGITLDNITTTSPTYDDIIIQ